MASSDRKVPVPVSAVNGRHLPDLAFVVFGGLLAAPDADV